MFGSRVSESPSVGANVHSPAVEQSLEEACGRHSPSTAPSHVLMPVWPPRGRTSRSQAGLSCSPSTCLGRKFCVLQMCDMQSWLLLSSGQARPGGVDTTAVGV